MHKVTPSILPKDHDVLATLESNQSTDHPSCPEEVRGGADPVNPVKNVILNGGRLLMSFASGAVASASIARTLGTEAMGLYTYALWLSSILVAFCHFGLPTALTKFVAENSDTGISRKAVRIVRKLLFLQAAAVITVLIVGGSAVLYFSNLRSQMWWLVLIIVAPQAFQQALISILMGAQQYAELAWVGIGTSLLQIAAVAVALVVSPSVIGFLSAVVFASALSTALISWFVSRAMEKPSGVPEFSDKNTDLPVALRFVAPVSYLVLLDMVVWQRSEIFFLKRYSTLQEIAFYSLAFLLAGKLADVVGGITSTLLPMQSQAYARDGAFSVAEIQGKALRSVQAVLVPLSLFSAVLAKPLIVAMYGEAFSPVLPVLWILLLSPIAASATGIGIASIYTLGKQKSLLVPLTLVALLNIVLAASFVPRMGAVGAALANTSAQMLEGVFVLLFSTSMLSTAVPWRNLLVIYSAAILASAPAFIFGTIGAPLVIVVAAVVVGCTVYACSLTYFGEIAAGDWETIAGAIGRRLRVRTA